jgi:hypothetical protein
MTYANELDRFMPRPDVRERHEELIEAPAKFMRYWRLARFGIVLIRWLMLPAIRREAERRYREHAGLVARPY